MEKSPTPSTGIKEFIESLAKSRGVAYVKTDWDAWAEAVTRLADDEVNLDTTEQLIIALERAGVIASEEVVPLHVNYLREKLYAQIK